jgi:hypothetical protein
LERLNLSSNGAGAALLPALVSLLRSNKRLQQLDISCNDLGSVAGGELRAALVANAALTGFDVRKCGLGEEVEEAVMEEMLGRQVRRERIRLVPSAGQA